MRWSPTSTRSLAVVERLFVEGHVWQPPLTPANGSPTKAAVSYGTDPSSDDRKCIEQAHLVLFVLLPALTTEMNVSHYSIQARYHGNECRLTPH